jgi:hypothetical protein
MTASLSLAYDGAGTNKMIARHQGKHSQ